MKKWTLMVIPEGQGSTRTVHFYAAYAYAVLALITALSFTSAFFLQRSLSAQHAAEQLREEKYVLEYAAGTEVVADAALTEDKLEELEDEIRAPYEERDAALTSALSELYDLEAQVREIHGLPPRTMALVAETTEAAGGGQGGPLDTDNLAFMDEVDLAMLRPPQLIYGLSRPSADLMLQEISLRTESLRELLVDLATKQEQVARTPAVWPSLHASRRISSRFGHRRDPFTRALSRHKGVDIVAPYGSAVIATAKGTVVQSGYDANLGNLIKVDHGDGVATRYAHLQKRLVKRGDMVERGDIIGKLGSTGKRSTGPHVHYEVLVEGNQVNPERYISD
jgi:murein DD-endopeptidase MepM/ murein hydrolase activator NlpD